MAEAPGFARMYIFSTDMKEGVLLANIHGDVIFVRFVRRICRHVFFLTYVWYLFLPESVTF